MDNYSHDSLYPDLLGFSSTDNLKGKPDEVNYSLNNSYREPVNNIMTEDGIYSFGMIAGTPINYSTPSPVMGYSDSAPMMGHQNLSPMMGYEDSTPIMGYNNPSFDQGFQMEPEQADLKLTPELTAMVNSLLIDNDNDNSFNVDDFDLNDVDVAAAAMLWQDDDANNFPLDVMAPAPMGMAPASGGITSPTYGTQPDLLPTININHLQNPSVRPRKSKKTKTKIPSVDEAAAIPSPVHMGYDSYPRPEDLGVPSPSSSTYSDTGSSNDETHKPRQRRPRVSYDTLTEEEKYQRIRDLNNEASKHYRQRQRSTFSQLEQQLPSLIEKNQHLKDKAEALEKLRDQMKHYSNAFLKQHMANTNVNNGY